MDHCYGGFHHPELWTFENGMIKNILDLGKCLDVPSGTSVDGTRIIVHDCWGGMQKWTFEQRPGYNYGWLRDLHGKCLMRSGILLVINTCAVGILAEQWEIQ
jgi:hypothetical protein